MIIPEFVPGSVGLAIMMRFSRHRAVLLTLGVSVAVCFVAAIGGAATYHVSPQGSNTPPYDTYATAAHEVADAVLAASGYGDTVLVHTGSYICDTTIWIPEGLTLAGVGRDSVVLIWGDQSSDPGWITRVGGDNELYGIEFHWPGGNKNLNVWGISTYNNTSVVIHDCRFYHLRTSFYGQCALEVYENEFLFNQGWAIFLSNAQSWIHDNTFHAGKYSGDAIGTLYAGSVLIEHNRFDCKVPDAWGYQAIIAEESGTITVRNNLILNTKWPLTLQSSSGIIENNTIVAAGDEWHSVLFRLRPQDSVLCRNNIMQDHTMPVAMSPACSNCPPTSGPITFLYNAYWPPVGSFWVMYGDYYEPEQVQLLDSANFNAYPMFTYDSAFNLQRASPLIDTGDPSVLDPDGSHSDIGWTGGPGGRTYEYPDLPPLAPDSFQVSGDSAIVVLSWSLRPETDLAGYRLYRGETSGFWSPGRQPLATLDANATTYEDTLAAPADSAFYVITAVDSAGLESGPSLERRYVKPEPQVNHAPVIDAVSPQTVTEEDTLTLVLTASDADEDSLTWAVEDLPANADFTDHGNGTATLAFRPDTTQAGHYGVRFIVSDTSLADTVTVDITVAPAPVPNRAPVIAPVGSQTVTEGDTLTLVLTATDDDADSLVWSAENLPANADFTDYGDGTATFFFRPDSSQSGEHDVRFIVSDKSLADTLVVLMIVEAVQPSLSPNVARIVRAYPNPTNGPVVIDVNLPESYAPTTYVQVVIYDILAKQVVTLDGGSLSPGNHSLHWAATSARDPVASGVYFARLKINGTIHGQSARLVIIK